MCLDEKCGRIDIIEIYDDIKVVIHYERNGNKQPFFIQYWDTSKPCWQIPAKNINLEFILRDAPPKFVEIGEEWKCIKIGEEVQVEELFSVFS
jgi:hypothetical protein